jgi:hypothetical protein
LGNGSNPRNDVLVPAAFLLAAGVALGGWFIGHGFEARRAERFVTVKGVSERDVTADVALWPIRYVATDNVLARAQSGVEEARRKVTDFLASRGIQPEQVEVQKLEVNDLLANPWSGQQLAGRNRYIVTQTLMVRSKDPERVRAASQQVGSLVEAGVVLQAGDMGGGPTYLYTRLNDVKPDMIAEATAEARRAAEQFARDSKSRLGDIRQASQGVFQILPRDRAPGIQEEMQLEKTVRVVTTVDYFLSD